MPQILDKIVFFFPFQLVFLHVKKNLALVAVWILFIVSISGGIGKIYGIPYLFLDPEYLNNVGFMSFFLVGLAFGNLVMAFHITCYILDSHVFTFIGVLERPFTKFTLNNSIIPFISLIVYIILIVKFQLNNEYTSAWNLVFNILGLLFGIVVMASFFFIYFRFTNKDIFKFLAGAVDKRLKKATLSRERALNKLKETKERKYTVRSYLDLKFRIRSCENLLDFYDKEAVLKVFDQNHFNSVIIELAIIILLLLLGSFMDYQIVQIPAAASALLMFSILLMLVGAVTYWFRGWGLSFVFILFLIVNLLIKTGGIKGIYHARGLDYQANPAEYTLENLKKLNSQQQFDQDKERTLGILDNWKAKQTKDKPNAVFLCVSGGGQRAALWTVNVLHHADSIIGGDILKRSVLITGASGGTIGAAYYRELSLRSQEGLEIPTKKEQLERIGKDNLNAIIFSLLVNDAFFRIRTYDYHEFSYKKDRGYVFEQNLNKNLNRVFSKTLSDYSVPEQEARVPMLIMSPVIANDGRKLYLSPQGVSYMNVSKNVGVEPEYKIRGADFNQLFVNQGAKGLSFLSALRMSASFPYITPTITLPSIPTIEIMDAGISDNFGVGDAIRFVEVFQEWFETNTSGISFIIIRDTRKTAPIEPRSNPSLIDRIIYPIASVYNNLGNIQDINNDARIETLKDLINVPVEVVEFEYNTYTNIDEEYLLTSKEIARKEMERASLSWHLTTKEKQTIVDNIYLSNNQKALRKLENILK